MYKIKFYFKFNFKYKKKKNACNDIINIFLLKHIFKNSKITIKKVFFNKYLMLRSPFHYKVSKRLLYNKQGIVIFETFFLKNFNFFFFKNFFSINSNDNYNLFLIKVYNKY